MIHTMYIDNLRKYKYPPAKQEEAITLVLEQAETLSAEWEE
jgi:type I restriction enzyme, R subunit